MIADVTAGMATFVGLGLTMTAVTGWFALMQNAKTSVVASAFGLFAVGRFAPHAHCPEDMAFLGSVALIWIASAVQQIRSSRSEG